MDSRAPQRYINFCILKVVVNCIAISYYSSFAGGGGGRESQQFTKHYQLIQGKLFPKRTKFPESKTRVLREVNNREMQLMSLNRSKNCGAPRIMVSPKALHLLHTLGCSCWIQFVQDRSTLLLSCSLLSAPLLCRLPYAEKAFLNNLEDLYNVKANNFLKHNRSSAVIPLSL